MNTLNDYRAIQKNTGLVPRTLSEANKDADYATPIWRCETENENGFKFLGDALIGFFYVWVAVGAGYALLYWLGVV